MKNLTLAPLVMSLLMTSLSVSANWTESQEYNDWSKAKAVSYSGNDNENLALYLATDARGISRFYISASYSNANICSNQGGQVANVSINNVSVKFNAWCKVETEKRYAILELTPVTENGTLYIVDAFVKSKNVKVNTNLGGSFSQDVMVSAKGFAKALNEITRPAL